VKVARFHSPGDIRIEDAAEPDAGPGEVKLRVRNCSTHIRPPRVMGHEIAGEGGGRTSRS
jgi:L-iditol 2-dehydrogenase